MTDVTTRTAVADPAGRSVAPTGAVPPAGPPRAVRRRARVVLAVLLTVAAAVACEQSSSPAGGSAARSSAPEAGTSLAATPTPATAQSGSAAAGPVAPAAGSLPAEPALRPVQRLAEQIGLAESVLRHRRSTPAADFRRAAEFQQLAARMLATAPSRLRQAVLQRVDPAAAGVTRSNVLAASLLQAMTSPQSSLPTQWRIVDPPPSRVLLRHYRRAGRTTGVPWPYLAAIHLVETRMGRIRGTSSAGAQGPMQFLPSTWEAYGGGGDINDPADAILAAGRLLRANGAPRDMAGALWNYNHSDAYVRAVTTYARVMRAAPRSYHSYWHWRVLYKHRDGTYVLPVGYPRVPPELID